jgi:(1->4)-alpha-D-glucan 1-alpha-D-glucosylmutase
MAQDWAAVTQRLLELSERHRRDGAPDDVERYFLFQTLVGVWPIELERVEAYMVKALREAKRNTSWVNQRHDYERAVIDFCRALYADHAFLAALEPFAARVASAGERSAVGQLVLKLTAPGIPDIYQGDELPYLALVDPDNRRPVDWGYRDEMLRRLMGGAGGSRVPEETRKLFLTMRLLGLRARRPGPFSGSYEPLDAGGGACAYVRGGEVLVVVAVRDSAVGEGALADAPGGRWRDVLSGEERSFDSGQPLARLLDEHGVGVFERL